MSKHCHPFRVSLFFVGVQKAGTTSMFAHCREHPALCPPRNKEPHFFDNETLDWSEPNLNVLHRLFPAQDVGRMRFDATPIYCFWQNSLERIQRYNPDAKLVYLFRDPIERAWSHWRMEFARGWDTMAFTQAIRQGRKRLPVHDRTANAWRVYSYVERGLYAEQVRRGLRLFPRENLLFLDSQKFLLRHEIVLDALATFLGIAPFPDSGPKREHVRSPSDCPHDLTEEDVQYLADIFNDDVQEFSSLTGIDVRDWLISRTCRQT